MKTFLDVTRKFYPKRQACGTACRDHGDPVTMKTRLVSSTAHFSSMEDVKVKV
jgi:hypothetical protein